MKAEMSKIIVFVCFIVGFGVVSLCAWKGFIDNPKYTSAEHPDTSKAILIYKREVDAQISALNAQLDCYLTVDSLIRSGKLKIIVVE